MPRRGTRVAAWVLVLLVTSLTGGACSLVVDMSELNAGCPRGEKDCGNGCEKWATSTGCGNAECSPCDLPNVAEYICHSTGVCAPAQGGCAEGFADCNQNVSAQDGCEVDIYNSPTTCGRCGNDCTTNSRANTFPNSEPPASNRCVQGVCVPRCLQGFGDCVSGGGLSAGCETEFASGLAVDESGKPVASGSEPAFIDHCGACSTETTDMSCAEGDQCVAGECQ
jgi:hypothetical protein